MRDAVAYCQSTTRHHFLAIGLLTTSRLDPARTRLISGFMDTYLHLNTRESQVFQEEIGKLGETEKANVMAIVTSWMEEGIEQGLQRERSLILRQLARRVGELPELVRSHIDTLPIAQLEALGEALLDFSNLSDLEAWLEQSDQGARTDALQ